MAKNSIYVRSKEDPSLLNAEGAITGAAKGALIGSFVPIPGIGTVSGAAIGAVVGTGAKFLEQQQEQTTGHEVKAPSMFNREMLVTAGTIMVTGAVTGGIGFLPGLLGLGATVVAGKLGERRMENEYAEAKMQAGADQVQSARAMQANNFVAQQEQSVAMGGKNTVSAEDYARMQAAQQNRGVHGKFTQAALQQQDQQLALSGAGR